MNPPSSSSRASSEPSHAENSSEGPVDADVVSPIVILGGGDAGTALLEALTDSGLAADVTLIEPSPHHYEQPEWLRVGTEGIPKEDTRSPERAEIPTTATWIQSRATEIAPDAQVVATEDGTTVRYDYLVVALGTEVLWDRIRGLKPNLGSQGICSVYGYEQAERTWEMIRTFEGGQALFTAPSSPYKGGSAPMTILRRASVLWRDTGVRNQTDMFYTTGASDKELEEMIDRDDGWDDDIHVYTGYELIDVRPEAGEAVFSVRKGQSQSRDVLRYDLLHVVPPMRPPVLLEASGLAYRDGLMKGYMEVDPETFRHKRFRSVFGIGDAIGVEGVKTGERARMQAAAVARTLQEISAGEE